MVVAPARARPQRPRRLALLALAEAATAAGGAAQVGVAVCEAEATWLWSRQPQASGIASAGCASVAGLSLLQRSAGGSPVFTGAVGRLPEGPASAAAADLNARAPLLGMEGSAPLVVRKVPEGCFQNGSALQEVLANKSATVPVTVRQRHLTRATAAQEVHDLAKDGIVPATGIMMTAFLFGSSISSYKYTKFIPETLCTLAVAMLLGVVIRNMMGWGWITMEGFTLVDSSILNLLLLPIIVFEGGWSVNAPHFMAQFPYIVVFAILGTIISTLCIGYSSWYLGAVWGVHSMTDWRSNFAFASLISATDPVATLTTFTQLRIAEKQPLLNTLVFGESMLNDAVAIVLFNAINSRSDRWQGLDISLGLQMCVFLFGSMILGLVLASALVLPLRIAKLPGNTLPEVLYVFLSPYFVFAMTETLEFSGIIATLFAGIVFRLYGSQHLTAEGKEAANSFLGTFARFSESGVFIICGTSAALITSRESFHYGLVALGLCLVSRAVAVSVCSSLSNRLKHLRDDDVDDMITWKHKFMIWLSGLRGGIGLVLALQLDETWCGEESKSTIINTTFFLICALLLLCGGMTEPCLTALGLLQRGQQDRDAFPAFQHAEQQSLTDLNQLTPSRPSEGPRVVGGFFHAWLQYLLVGSRKEEPFEPMFPK